MLRIPHFGYGEFSKANMFPVNKKVEQLKINHFFNIIHGTATGIVVEDDVDAGLEQRLRLIRQSDQ